MRGALGARQWRRLPPPPPLPLSSSLKKKVRLPRPSKRLLLRLLVVIALIAFVPPVFFHFRLRLFNQMRMRKCDWLESPPLLCAHGGDSSRAAPNTMDAYHIAIQSHVDCIEIDVSRSLDGTLFALHDRDLQRMSGNSTAKVGFMSTEEINKLEADFKLGLGSSKYKVPTIHEALMFVSGSVRQVVLDVKVGPPSFEKDLAKDVLSAVHRSECKNCLIWAKSDVVVQDVVKLKEDAMVGYIVMKDPDTGAMSNLLRMENAVIVGVYHPLIDKRLVQILHGSRKKVYAWTVDDPDSMRGLLYEHVDAIVTGNPSLLQKLMQELKTECLAEGFSLP
ncbi:glycerophosphodiester phosphodiesterase GDPD4 [Phalaenopsis equestris]|uniref:glycerophosphodiester phosphodiesterase GDPD4 n=1 Tax=Phalaenopsis equestris TaxID=78828 RepID=UPI0009E4A0F1|nr:glycerophosphodiester phosphodiesterase GDPD4 [Phalaenopsis equestris]